MSGEGYFCASHLKSKLTVPPSPWSTGQWLREPSPFFSPSGEGGVAYLSSTCSDEEEVAPRPSALPAPTCATGVLCSCVRGQAGNKNAGARGHADSAGTRKHGLVFLPRAWPSAVSPWVATRCGGRGQDEGGPDEEQKARDCGPSRQCQ